MFKCGWLAVGSYVRPFMQPCMLPGDQHNLVLILKEVNILSKHCMAALRDQLPHH
jgi:hypothetical protein